MPTEYTMLENKPSPIASCPKCQHAFVPFLRGIVQRGKKSWLGLGSRRPYCALICEECKEIVGYEDPDGSFEVKS